MKAPFTAEHAEREPILHGDHSPLEKEIVDVVDRSAAIRFRRFSLLPRTRRLLLDGETIDLGDRAFDLLVALLARPGALLTKHELIACVWPSISVEEGNLHVQISALRRALGKDRDVIRTVSGRGYMFVGEITMVALAANGAVTTGQEPGGAAAGPPQSNSIPGGRLGAEAQRALDHDGRPAVAVIDDDSDIRHALSGLLESVGIGVELFSSVQEFLEGDRLSLPDCFVLDVRLPGRSGLDFLDELARAGVTVPVIFISGYADVPMSVRAMKAGAFEFLTKPVRHQDLLDAIQRAIGARSVSRSTFDSLSV